MTDKTKLAAAREWITSEYGFPHDYQINWDAEDKAAVETILALLDQAIGKETDATHVLVPIEKLNEWQRKAYRGRVQGHKCDADAACMAIDQSINDVRQNAAHPPAVDWIEGLRRHDGTTNGEDDYVYGWNACLDHIKKIGGDR